MLTVGLGLSTGRWAEQELRRCRPGAAQVRSLPASAGMRRIVLVCSGIAIAAMVAAIAAGVLASSSVKCAIPKENSRPLDLDNRSDLDHLKADLALVGRTAERFRAYVRTIPLRSQSIDARQTIATRPDRAYRYCMAILTDQVAAAHHLDAGAIAAFK